MELDNKAIIIAQCSTSPPTRLDLLFIKTKSEKQNRKSIKTDFEIKGGTWIMRLTTKADFFTEGWLILLVSFKINQGNVWPDELILRRN